MPKYIRLLNECKAHTIESSIRWVQFDSHVENCELQLKLVPELAFGWAEA